MLPVLLKHAVPLHDVVKVDLHVPGCPPSAAADPVLPQRTAGRAYSGSRNEAALRLRRAS